MVGSELMIGHRTLAGSYLLSKMARCKSMHLPMEMLSLSPAHLVLGNPAL